MNLLLGSPPFCLLVIRSNGLAFYFPAHPGTVTAEDIRDAASLRQRITQMRPDLTILENTPAALSVAGVLTRPGPSHNADSVARPLASRRGW